MKGDTAADIPALVYLFISPQINTIRPLRLQLLITASVSLLRRPQRRRVLGVANAATLDGALAKICCCHDLQQYYGVVSSSRQGLHASDAASRCALDTFPSSDFPTICRRHCGGFFF